MTTKTLDARIQALLERLPTAEEMAPLTDDELLWLIMASMGVTLGALSHYGKIVTEYRALMADIRTSGGPGKA